MVLEILLLPSEHCKYKFWEIIGLNLRLSTLISVKELNVYVLAVAYMRPGWLDTGLISSYLQNLSWKLLRKPPLNDDEEYVSYAVYSLLTSIPVAVTVEYNIHQIYI